MRAPGIPVTQLVVPDDHKQQLLDWNLRNEAVDIINRHNWPVKSVHRIWPASESDFGRDTILFTTPGDVPMTALLGVNGYDKPYVEAIWEGWTNG